MPIPWTLQDPPILSFSPKRIPETLTFGFDFINLLASGETINSGIWYVVPVRPFGGPIGPVIVGLPTISGTQFFQQIASGTEGATFNIVARIFTNFSNVIEQGALLVTTNNAFE